MTSRYHRIRLIISLFIIIPIIFLLSTSNLPWQTPGAATAYYSILAFLCVAISASAANRVRMEPTPSNNALFACTGYASIVFSGAAIFYILTEEIPVIHVQTAGIFLNLVALATTGILILLYSSLDQFIKKENSIWERKQTPFILILIGTLIFGVSIVFARLPFDNSVFLITGYLAGIIAVISYLAAALRMYQRRDSIKTNDPFRLMIGFLLFAGASVNHILILPSPTSMWIVSIALIALALIIANIAISYTYLLDISVNENIAYVITIVTTILAIVPFIISHLIEALIGSEVIIDIGATLIVHMGGAMLAGISAYTLYSKLRHYSSPGQIAIISLLLYWMISELAIVFSHFTPAYGFASETLTPYICGSVLSSFLLFLAIRRVLNPHQNKLLSSNSTIILVVIGSPILIFIGELLRTEVIIGIFGITEAVIGLSIMLGLSYISLYCLLTYILLLTASSGGKFTFDSVGAALVSIWVVIIILKTNFGYATPGWWVAEAIMLLSIIGLSLLLLLMYLDETKKFESATVDASLYSELVSNAIVGHQETAIDLLSNLAMDVKMTDDRRDSITLILDKISSANELTRYLQILISGNSFDRSTLETIDAIDSIRCAANRLGIPDSVRQIKDKDRIHGLVLANSLLEDGFYYLLDGVMKRLGSIEVLGIGILEEAPNVEGSIEIVLDIIVGVHKIDESLGFIRRYTEVYPDDVVEFGYAKRLIGLFKGSMKWHSELASGNTLSISVQIVLPSGK
ncbi:MAG: hypothetical protein JW779_02050 [Candidatus Thorarchaeota archaeon]|nr:hypothetical protein [Candidatus Thorarchaeota archaeon]